MVVSVPSQRQRSSSCVDDQDDDVDDDVKSRYLAIDCEMVGIGPLGTTSRLARVAVVNWRGEVVYDAHVRVEERVTDYRTFVSGITPEDLLESSGAVSFDEARSAVVGLIRGRVLVGHGLRNDFAALGIWDHPWHDVRDTARYEPFMRSPGPGEYNPTGAALVPKKLRTLARDKLGVEIQVEGTPHSPVEDAVAALGLYRRHRAKWERAVTYKVKRTREIRDAVDAVAIEVNQR
jgi:RNA exonuclease 4